MKTAGKKGKAGRVYRLTEKAKRLLPIAKRFREDLEKASPKFRRSFMELPDSDGFPCPNCNASLSPDDFSNKSYTIKPLPKGDVLIQCNCGAEITIEHAVKGANYSV